MFNDLARRTVGTYKYFINTIDKYLSTDFAEVSRIS